MRKQTIKDKISLTGVGLHTGDKITVNILPSDKGKIEFIRNGVRFDGLYNNVVSTNFAVTLGKDGTNISTVEHLLAAFHALGVDSAIVEVDGPEIPILDGSSYPFVEAIQETGLKKINKERKFFVVDEPFEVSMEDKYILFLPSDKFEINYTISFNHPLLDKQTAEVTVSRDSFVNEISKARTFTFLNVVNDLRKKGLIKGGSLDNAIVLDENGIYNGELRMEKECVKHKILDFIGDIFLLGKPIKGRIIAYKSGHTLDVKAVKTLHYYEKYGKEKILSSSGALNYITTFYQK